MKRNSSITLAIAAVIIYIVGGAFVFSGIGLIVFGGNEDLFGWGTNASIGYLWLAMGCCLSIIGVLIMRLCRNRALL